MSRGDQARPREAERPAIQFHKAPPGGDLVATAEVQIFEEPAVVLRGWSVYRRGEEVIVVPPYRAYKDPATGEKKVWFYLQFDDETVEETWKAQIKREFLRWEQR